MTSWSERPSEEKSLLNPAFCTNLLWQAAREYARIGSGALSFEESFLILPIVLHRETREALPHSTRTSLTVWLDQNPLARGRVESRARQLVPFTKEALTFGGIHGLLRLEVGKLHANNTFRSVVDQVLVQSSDEVRDCAKRAGFLGRWFAQTGSAATVFALIGVRP